VLAIGVEDGLWSWSSENRKFVYRVARRTHQSPASIATAPTAHSANPIEAIAHPTQRTAINNDRDIRTLSL
jgi:hypothetical protein